MDARDAPDFNCCITETIRFAELVKKMSREEQGIVLKIAMALAQTDSEKDFDVTLHAKRAIHTM